MHVHFWVWAATVGAIVAMLVFDFFAHVRTPHAPSFKESTVWSLIYIGIAVLFGVGMGLAWNWGHAGEYFAGYLTEKSLSVDNLFVFLIIMTKFAVPREDQQKVLLVGVVIALVLRAMFILAGAAVIEHFSWVFYLFGAFLLWTAYGQARHKPGEAPPSDVKDTAMVRVVRRFVPTTSEYHGDRLTAVIDGRRVITPMLLVMIAIGSTDVLFAVDSIPAIFGLTKEAYIVFTANAFALLGLRQLYFLISGLLERLIYLSQGLAVILGFIGVKLVLEALHSNELPFINGGEPVPVPVVPTWMSLTVIVLTLIVVTILSLARTRDRVMPAIVKDPPHRRTAAVQAVHDTRGRGAARPDPGVQDRIADASVQDAGTARPQAGTGADETR